MAAPEFDASAQRCRPRGAALTACAATTVVARFGERVERDHPLDRAQRFTLSDVFLPPIRGIHLGGREPA